MKAQCETWVWHVSQNGMLGYSWYSSRYQTFGCEVCVQDRDQDDRKRVWASLGQEGLCLRLRISRNTSKWQSLYRLPAWNLQAAVVFILLYVDNTGIRSNCPQSVENFYAHVRANGKIDWNISWFSVGSAILIWKWWVCFMQSTALYWDNAQEVAAWWSWCFYIRGCWENSWKFSCASGRWCVALIWTQSRLQRSQQMWTMWLSIKSWSQSFSIFRSIRCLKLVLLRVVWRGIWPNQLSYLESTKTASCKVCLGEKRCQIDFVCQQNQGSPSLWRYQSVCWFASGWRKDSQKVDKLSLYKILMIMTHTHRSHAHNHARTHKSCT